MFGFRKKNKRTNVRKRVETKGSGDESDEGEMINETPVESPKPVIPNVETKSKVKKSASALSFGDEMDDNEEFVIKKSKASLNMQEQVRKEKKKKKSKKGLIITGESETLVKEEESSPPPSKSKNNNGNKNKGGQFEIKTFEDDEEIDDNSVSHRFSSQSRFGRPGDIPDAATIYAMKKERERARQTSGQNFIPLNSNTHSGRFSNTNSRLVREEMEMNSSDEDRMEMKGKVKYDPYLERRTQVAKALEEAEEMEEDEGDDLQDEEIRNWENEQINKGTKIPASIREKYGPSLPSQQPSSMDIEPPTSYSIPNKVQTDMSVDYITKKLAEELSTKKQLHHIHTQDYEKIKFDLESSKSNIEDLEEKAAQLEEKFSFFQDTRGFSKDLLECLAEKVFIFVHHIVGCI